MTCSNLCGSEGGVSFWNSHSAGVILGIVDGKGFTHVVGGGE